MTCLTIQHNLWSLILSILELVSDFRDLRNSLKNLENSQKLLWSQLESYGYKMSLFLVWKHAKRDLMLVRLSLGNKTPISPRNPRINPEHSYLHSNLEPSLCAWTYSCLKVGRRIGDIIWKKGQYRRGWLCFFWLAFHWSRVCLS